MDRYSILKGKQPPVQVIIDSFKERALKIEDGATYAGKFKSVFIIDKKTFFDYVIHLKSNIIVPDLVGKKGSITVNETVLNFVVEDMVQSPKEKDTELNILCACGCRYEILEKQPVSNDNDVYSTGGDYGANWVYQERCSICDDPIDEDWADNNFTEHPLCRKKSCWEKFLPSDLVKKYFPPALTRYELLKKEKEKQNETDSSGK